MASFQSSQFNITQLCFTSNKHTKVWPNAARPSIFMKWSHPRLQPCRVIRVVRLLAPCNVIKGQSQPRAPAQPLVQRQPESIKMECKGNTNRKGGCWLLLLHSSDRSWFSLTAADRTILLKADFWFHQWQKYWALNLWVQYKVTEVVLERQEFCFVAAMQ